MLILKFAEQMIALTISQNTTLRLIKSRKPRLMTFILLFKN